MLDLGSIEAQAVISVAIVIALVEVVKRAYPKVANAEFPPELLPILGIIVGIAYHAFMSAGTAGWREIIAAGVVAGLLASGLYSGSKAVTGR